MKLGDACTIEKGNIGIMKAIPGDYPLVVLGDERRSHNEYQFDTEAVIIPLVSSTGHGHRSMKRIHYQSGKFSVGNILCAVIPKDKTTLSTEFLYRYLDLNKEDELVSRMKGMANVSLPMKSIADVEIPVPPIGIQQDIIKRFDKVEKSNGALSSEHTIQLEILKKLRQQILQDAVQGKLVPQDLNDEPASMLLERIKAEKEQLIRGKKISKEKLLPVIKPEEIPFEIPENWKWIRLGQVLEFSENLNIESEFPSDTMINYVDIDAIDNQKFEIREPKYKPVSELSSRARRVLKKGFVLYSLVRPYLNNIAIIDDEKENYIGSTGFVVFSGILVDNTFLKYYLLSDFIRKEYLRLLSGFNSPSISHEQFSFTILPLPPLSEQIRIVTKIEQLMKLCDELEQSIQQNQKYTQELLKVALKEALEPKFT
jgi:type I restriction enzyme S subunit